jgi:hypothetical protein
MPIEPPPPPPTAENEDRKRPWWQFGMRTLLIAMTVLAIFVFVGVSLPELLTLVVSIAGIGSVAGLIVGAWAHDFDRLRAAAAGAFAALMLAWMWDAPDYSGAILESVARIFRSSAGGKVPELLAFAVGRPLFALLVAVTGGLTTLKTAPYWHRLATTLNKRMD